MFNSLSTLLDTPHYPQTKEQWGKGFWVTMHNIAANYPEKPTRTQKRKMKELISGLIENIPCDDCKVHAKSYMRRNKIQLASKEKFSSYLCNFHNNVNKRLGKEEVDCNLILKSNKGECQTCKITVSDIDYSDYKNSIKKIVEQRCKEAGVPVPDIEFGECPIKDHNERSCTQANMETKTGKMIFNNKTASLRSVEHEIEHWIRIQKGEIEATKDEIDVDLTARARLNKDFEANSSTDLYSKLNDNKALVTLADYDSYSSSTSGIIKSIDKENDRNSGGIFSGIDAFYKPLSDLTKIPASALNDANTPEILGYSLDALGDITLTPFGNALVNMVTGVGLVGISIMMPELARRDKIFLNELGAHKFWSLIRYANPKTNVVAHQQAMAAGQALQAGNFNAIMNSIVQAPAPVAQARPAQPATVPIPDSVLKARGVNTPASMAKKAYHINHG